MVWNLLIFQLFATNVMLDKDDYLLFITLAVRNINIK